MNVLKQLFAISLFFTLAACGGGSGSAPSADNTLQAASCDPAHCAEDKSFSVLASGQDGSYTDNRSFMVVKSQQAFEQLWHDNGEWDTPPQVDFSKDMVIAVFNGRANSTGYNVDVVAVEDYQDELMVEVVLTKPDTNGDCHYATVITRPYQLVTIEQSTKAVQFRSYEEEVNGCE
ncbi:MAG: protease complex subunit PrcB family protein [Gammaproteobacteria bacterium]|nr:protease complex subunit PrcB family protein [Gammaproteobacteria bacterium]